MSKYSPKIDHIQWGLMERLGCELFSAWLSKSDKYYYTRIDEALRDACFDVYQTHCRILQHLHDHPVRRRLVERVVIDEGLNPITIEMGREQLDMLINRKQLFKKG